METVGIILDDIDDKFVYPEHITPEILDVVKEPFNHSKN